MDLAASVSTDVPETKPHDNLESCSKDVNCNGLDHPIWIIKEEANNSPEEKVKHIVKDEFPEIPDVIVLSSDSSFCSSPKNSDSASEPCEDKGIDHNAETKNNKKVTPNRVSLRQRRKKAVQTEKPPVKSPPPVVKEKTPRAYAPSSHFAGDIVWAWVPGHPLWPCLIANGPGGEDYTRLNASRRYHVQFFGHSPEHAWIYDSRVYKFSNAEEFDSLGKSLAKKYPKRPPRREIATRDMPNWNAAIEEINEAAKLSREGRLAKFSFVYVDSMPYKPGTEPKKASKKRPAKVSSWNCSIDGIGKVSVTSSGKEKRQNKLPSEDCAIINATLNLVVKKYMNLSKTLSFDSAKGKKCQISKTKTFHTCLHCQKVYSSIEALRKHITLMHDRPPTTPAKPTQPSDDNDSSFTCSVCGISFGNKRSLGQHRRFSHPSNVLPTTLPKPNGNENEKIPKDLIAIPVPILKAKTDPLTVIPKIRARSLGGPLNKKDPVCAVCEKNGDVLTCTKNCNRAFHLECVPENFQGDPFVCEECQTGNFTCIICSKQNAIDESLGELKRCNVSCCARYFHGTCLQIYKLKRNSDVYDKVTGGTCNAKCPSHTCATCLSKACLESSREGDLRKFKPINRARLFKCVRCPTAYHAGEECLAAGSILLGGLNIVCPAHFKPLKNLNHHNPVHISWCFVCSKGGKLICCAGCPAAFHAECIDLEDTPDDDWLCLDCSCGIRPLYDDIVWVKLGTYRWWPGQVTHPCDVPDNIARLNHGPGEFVVRFFGSNDYFWLSKCRVFLYQDGDNGATNRHCSRGISGVFKKALQEAEESFRAVIVAKQLQEEVKIAENDKKPAQYKHIRFNKPVGAVQIHTAALGEIAKCSCRRTEPNPCGPESECLNRMLMYECHPALCPAGDRCQNQRFQKCDYPTTEVFKTSWGGWGLRSQGFVKKGTFVNEYVGELVDEEECRRRIELAHDRNVTNFYMLTIDKDRIIDAGPKGNYSRFMNHCCDPNCETQKWSVNGDTRVGLFAIRDIPPGDEMTFNYNLDCLGNEKTKCMCGSKNCSGFIGVRPKVQSEGIKRDRKKKRRKRLENAPQHDDFCFRCRSTGTLVCCDFKGCLRAFCFVCLNLEKSPYGKWECPCHHCDWCGRRAQYFCSFCPNSFCATHVHNQLQPSIPNKFDTCLDHDPTTAEFEMAQVIAMVNDVMGTSTSTTDDDSVTMVPSATREYNGDCGLDEASALLGSKRKKATIPISRAKRSRTSDASNIS